METNPRTLTRRELLARGVAAGTALVVGAGFVAGSDAAWALEVEHLKPSTMATLIRAARDIYPHDHVPDKHYAESVKGHDSAEAAAGIEAGVAELDAAARARGAASYVDLADEADRVAILRSIEGTPFFGAVQGGMVAGLYNQKSIWPLFGYEGESFSGGGYIDRGFDDIDWL